MLAEREVIEKDGHFHTSVKFASASFAAQHSFFITALYHGLGIGPLSHAIHAVHALQKMLMSTHK